MSAPSSAHGRVVPSNPNSQQSSKPSSRHPSRPSTGHGAPSPFSNGGSFPLTDSSLNTSLEIHASHERPTWQDYLEQVKQVATQLGSGVGLVQEWEKSVIDPFKGDWQHLDDRTCHELRRRMQLVKLNLRRETRKGLFSGFVCPLQALVFDLDVDLIPVHNSLDESHIFDADTVPWFQVAAGHHTISIANRLPNDGESVDLSERLEIARNRACLQARSETSQYKAIYDQVRGHWNNLTRIQQQLAVKIFDAMWKVLKEVIATTQIPNELYYLWVPPVNIVCEALGVPYSSPSASSQSYSLSHRRIIVSDRKKLIYFP